MTFLHAGSLTAALCLLGCSRLVDAEDLADDEADATDESNSDATGDGDASTSVATADDGSTSVSTSDSTSDTGDSTSDTTDGGECPPEWIECPDGTCVDPFPIFGCCSYGGECAPGCEPQDADKGMGQCPGEPEYAWNGEACKEVCPCQGSDCADVYADPIACLEAHQFGCVGGMDFSHCPFDEPVSAISITGTILGEPIDLQAGTFGLFYGKGGGSALTMRFAVDELTLANDIAHPWTDSFLEGVLQVWAYPMVGVQDVSVQWGPGFDAMTMGTVTILDFDVSAPDELDYFVSGTLEVATARWDIAGSFGIRHCNPLNQYAP